MRKGVVLVGAVICVAVLVAVPNLAGTTRAFGVLAVISLAGWLIIRRRWPLDGTDRARADGEGVSGHARPARIPEKSSDIPGPERRAAIKALSLGALGAIPLVAAPGVLERLVIDRDSTLVGPGTGSVAAGSSAGLPVAGHEVAVNRRIRQWIMIFDLRYCDGCQSQGTPPQCTTACIESHYAPEPMEWIEVYEEGLPGGGTQFVPTPCQQCQNPPCVNVCPVGATFSTPEGVVLIDQDRCIGCRICMAACPYDRRFFNWGDPPVPPESVLADYSPDTQVPAQRGTVMKCDFCPDLVRAGTLPFCVQACPNDAIWYGDEEEDVATNGREIVSASRFLSENHAHYLKPHLGTEPHVLYIAGHGESVGRDPFTSGRVPTEWPWVERAKGAVTWSR